MTNAPLDEFQWLLSDAAVPFLEQATNATEPLGQLIAKLRKSLSETQAHLVLEQVDLRRRARVKFTRAERMFFTRRGLEQATDESIAHYKATHFPSAAPLCDLCCGVGGDLSALASIGSSCLAIDRDPILALIARTNCLINAEVAADTRAESIVDEHLANAASWHMDPDRRTTGHRATRLDLLEPNHEVIQRLLAINPHAAIKVAPASSIPPDWEHSCHREWIGSRGECRQQVLWFGNLAGAFDQRTATVVSSKQDRVHSIQGNRDVQPICRESIGRFVFDTHPCVRAAGLVGELASRYQLYSIGDNHAYLTGDSIVDNGLLSIFRVEDFLAFDLRRVKSMLLKRGIGQLEIKQRGTKHNLARLHQTLRLPGDRSATLLLLRLGVSELAILATRQ